LYNLPPRTAPSPRRARAASPRDVAEQLVDPCGKQFLKDENDDVYGLFKG
jgi:hypothetical protein